VWLYILHLAAEEHDRKQRKRMEYRHKLKMSGSCEKLYFRNLRKGIRDLPDLE
jgi:hypothetical protein